jgi:tRNA pseudouridine38-40 synthase
VQGRLQDAIFAFCGERVSVRGAGRTDAGVHALGQVAHFDLERNWNAFRVAAAVNSHLKPDPIVVLACNEAAADFDARFSASSRRYVYRILARRAPPALERHRVWWVPRALDWHAMQAAAQRLVGRHDFTTFRAAQCQSRSPLKTLDRLDVTSQGEEIRIEAVARSFLHSQVRSMVGSLKLVGEGRWTADMLAAALAAADRARCGAVAPAAGLYLAEVGYGEQAREREDEADVDEE